MGSLIPKESAEQLGETEFFSEKLGFFARFVSHKRLCHLSHLFNP